MIFRSQVGSRTGLDAPLPRVPRFDDRIGLEALEIYADRFHLTQPLDKERRIVARQQLLDLVVGRDARRPIVVSQCDFLRGLHRRDCSSANSCSRLAESFRT